MQPSAMAYCVYSGQLSESHSVPACARTMKDAKRQAPRFAEERAMPTADCADAETKNKRYAAVKNPIQEAKYPFR